MRSFFLLPFLVLMTLAAAAQLPADRNSSTPAISQPPSDSLSSSTALTARPQELLRHAHTVYIASNTAFLPVATITRALLRQKQWEQLNLLIVESPKVADLRLQIDRIVFTHIHTFVLSDTKTSIVLGSGRQTAFDGNLASGGLAKDIVSILAAERLPSAVKP